jgi:hypothetical protein
MEPKDTARFLHRVNDIFAALIQRPGIRFRASKTVPGSALAGDVLFLPQLSL